MLFQSYMLRNACLRFCNNNCLPRFNNVSINVLPLWRHNLFSTSPNKLLRTKLKSGKNVQTLEPPVNGILIEPGNLPISCLWKPFLFTIAFSTASIVGVTIWQYENLRSKVKTPLYSSARWAQEKTKKLGKWRNDFNKWWNRLADSEKVFASIASINLLVFLAWRIPKFQPVMVKYFCSNPAGSALCWPMVLCTFSHYSGLHLFTNMYVLHSFSTGTVTSLGKEQFLGFYLAAGVISSFVSCVHKVIVKRPGLSLGASGAIMAILGFMCTRFPDQELSIIFLPMFTFKAASAIKVIMGIDLVGVIMGWRFIDHAAHLGGALFGIFWSYWGTYHIWQKRGPILQLWHDVRDPTHK